MNITTIIPQIITHARDLRQCSTSPQRQWDIHGTAHWAEQARVQARIADLVDRLLDEVSPDAETRMLIEVAVYDHVLACWDRQDPRASNQRIAAMRKLREQGIDLTDAFDAPLVAGYYDLVVCGVPSDEALAQIGA